MLRLVIIEETNQKFLLEKLNWIQEYVFSTSFQQWKQLGEVTGQAEYLKGIQLNKL